MFGREELSCPPSLAPDLDASHASIHVPPRLLDGRIPMRLLHACAVALFAFANTPLQAQTVAARASALPYPGDYVPLESIRKGDARLLPAALARAVTMRAERMPLERAVEAIARQADLGISYGEDLVRSNTLVSLAVDQVSAAEALELATRGTGWRALVTHSGQLTVVRRPRSESDIQAGTVAGQVTGPQGEPLSSATVTV